MAKNILIVLGLLATVALGYYVFVLDDQSLQTANAEVVSEAELQSREFLRRLQELRQVNIQTEVLNDPRFTNRIDYGREVPTLPAGRENPFLPTNDAN